MFYEVIMTDGFSIPLEVLWFFAGALTFQILSIIIGYYHSVGLLAEVTAQILKLIGTTADDVAFIKTIKFKFLNDSGLEEEEINRIKEIDEQVYDNWKASIITKLIAHYPRKFRTMLNFYDWVGAMKALDDIYKKEARFNNGQQNSP